MAGIFLSYRREESGGYSLAIYDRLSQHFGQHLIFRDIDTMDYGVDFVEAIEQAVSSCDVLIAVIGREWLTMTNDTGQRRLDDPNDFVRLEIETALKRKIRVVPALVGSATMPKGEDLPDSLRNLARRHGVVLGEASFRADVDRLIQSLTKVVESPQNPPALSPSPPVIANPPKSEPPAGMELIEKGPFLYGDDRIKENLTYDFWIDIHQVTNRQFRQFLDAGGYEQSTYWSNEGWTWRNENNIVQPDEWENANFNQPDQPVVGVSYYEAEAFAKWAGKRLPTEQEWEKAARGTDGREYPWGEEFNADRCANSVKGARQRTVPVGTFPEGASPYGCYDMAGNVWEWCASWYTDKPTYRVLRGGSWDFDNPEDFRCALRNYFDPRIRNFNFGFRCVQDAP